MKFEIDSVLFRVNVYFPDCNVDVVFAELSVSAIVPSVLVGSGHKVSKPKTPTAKSIGNCLNCLEANEEIKKLGVTITETYGLMMGCCHFVCRVDADKYTPELSSRVVNIATEVFKKRIKYHNA